MISRFSYSPHENHPQRTTDELKSQRRKPGEVAHAYNPKPREAEAGGSLNQDLLGLHSEFQNNRGCKGDPVPKDKPKEKETGNEEKKRRTVVRHNSCTAAHVNHSHFLFPRFSFLTSLLKSHLIERYTKE